MPKPRRGHNSKAPGAKKARSDRSNKGEKRLSQEAWDREFQKLLLNAPKHLKTPEERMNWAMEEMQRLYRFKLQRIHH